jgi:hypothetical protein
MRRGAFFIVSTIDGLLPKSLFALFETFLDPACLKVDKLGVIENHRVIDT